IAICIKIHDSVNLTFLWLQLFINNEWVESKSGKTFDTVNPATGEVITQLQRGSKEDVDVAVEAAKEAFKLGSPWRKLDAAKRGKLIYKLAELLERDSVLLSSLEALECGKVYVPTLKGDLPWAVRNLRYFAGMADKGNGITAQIDGNFMAYTRQEPVGICGLITAWNFSLLMITWKLAPAIAAGCTMVLKPSQHTCLAALHLGELVKEAGIPPGVVNIVPGFSDVGSAIAEHPEINKISFTGSTPVGQKIYEKGALNMKRLTLELGGKSPNIILKGANIDEAVEHAHYAAFHNMGQCCCAGSRTFVHESLYDEFVEKSKARIKARRIGNPFDLDVDHGPQATQDQLDVVMKYIEIGKKEGGHVEVGGNRIDRPGFYVEPTLFTNVKDEMTISREE
ncbi:aldehyde dehydrogenase, mitochondrial-like, partial [Cimex lectularius]|uniref:Aldehyde dehydrogenase domain-containing protein n=1 Tax=Cimex lectularius TaxID=79782 RepID=A0A8I6TLD9_CIMLE